MVKKYIKNRKQLLSHGNFRLRESGLSIIESALRAANPYQAAKDLIHLAADKLTIASLEYDLSEWGKIYVIGAGKATLPIAKALEEILGPRISRGLIVLKKGQAEKLSRIEVIEGSHPIPDEEGFRASKEIMKIAGNARQKDIVISCITGGSSALLPFPIDSVTLNEKKEVNRLLLSSGASIFEINAVRKHLSKIKGGRLGRAVFPAELINLTVSDVIGDALDYITGPTVPDTSTFNDALKTMQKYNLWIRVPASVRAHIEAAEPTEESPRDYAGCSYHNFILTGPDTVCQAAADAARGLGFTSLILSTQFDGESKELGRSFAAIAREIRRAGRPVKPPCAIIGGGETVVTLSGNFGKGGPNQEFALGFILNMEGQSDYLVAGIDTDGTDGPTYAAGALCDEFSLKEAEKKRVDLHQALENHAVLESLEAIGDAVVTGHTGTNVNDLKIILCE